MAFVIWLPLKKTLYYPFADWPDYTTVDHNTHLKNKKKKAEKSLFQTLFYGISTENPMYRVNGGPVAVYDDGLFFYQLVIFTKSLNRAQTVSHKLGWGGSCNRDDIYKMKFIHEILLGHN